MHNQIPITNLIHITIEQQGKIHMFTRIIHTFNKCKSNDYIATLNNLHNKN